MSGGILAGLTAVAFALPDVPKEQSSRTAAPQEYPPGELGRVVKVGEEIVRDTGRHPLSKSFVGNSLTCSSCHLDAGTDPQAATFLGVAAAYPAWSPREKRVITLEDRVLNCFMRSMNGVRPPNGSEVSVAVATYITWLSTGERIAMNAKASLGPNHVLPLSIESDSADATRGEKIYGDQCASCHGEDGLGTEEGPPVWGEKSYNDGAGLARNHKLGAWLKVAMPAGDPSLTEQEALDVAAYVNSKPRPKFILKEHLLPPEQRDERNVDQSQ